MFFGLYADAASNPAPSNPKNKVAPTFFKTGGGGGRSLLSSEKKVNEGSPKEAR